MIRWVFLLLLWPSQTVAQNILQIEQQLSAIGYSVGQVDGVSDVQTRQAVMDFQYSFGFNVTGELTADEVIFLAKSEQISQMQVPFAIEELREEYRDLEQIFNRGPQGRLPRNIYANGAHYLAERGYFQYNPTHLSLGSAIFAPLMDSERERRNHYRKIAKDISVNTRNELGAAVLTLSDWDNEVKNLDETMGALELLLSYAESAPKETAYLASLIQGIERRVNPLRACMSVDDAQRVFPLISRTITLAMRSTLSRVYWARILSLATACSPQDTRDNYYQVLLDISQQVSPTQEIITHSLWAQDAKERGADDTARLHFAQAADAFLAGLMHQDINYADVSNGLMQAGDVTAMYYLNMTTRVQNLGNQRIDQIESIPFASIDLSFASASNYNYALVETSLLFMETRQFDNLRRLGVFLAGRQFDAIRGQSEMMPETTAIWESALIGLRSLKRSEEHQQLLNLATIIMPTLLSERANLEALEVSLMQAEAAIELGFFEDAELAMIQAVTLANITSSTAKIEPRIISVRRALNLWKLADLTAADKLIDQLETHYALLCGPDVAQRNDYYQYPSVDFETLGSDPSVAAALLKNNMMDQILTCGISRAMTETEARLICALAGFTGRRDVANYFLNNAIAGVENWERYPSMELCAHGLADAGHSDWFQLETLPSGDTISESNIRFFAMSPIERQAASQSVSLQDIDDIWDWTDIRLEHLEKNFPLPQRQELFKATLRKFEGSFGRIGAQEEDYFQVANLATAYRRMGLFRAAEAHLYIGARVDPFAFGTEPAEKLAQDLLIPLAVHNRLQYAKLYRAEGDSDRAYSAIGPLAEYAVARLTTGTDPLPGTVEQWAKRLEPLFTAYLEIQFDGVSNGANYPVIFAIKQYLHLANSSASATVLEQRLKSANPDVARQYQDARRKLRLALDNPSETGTQISDLSLELRSIEAQLPKRDAALRNHQIGVTRDIGDVILELRNADAAMLVVTQLPKSVILMYLDGNGATGKRLQMSRADVNKMVISFRTGLLETNGVTNLFDESLAANTYEDLIGWAHSGKEPPPALRLVLDGPLSILPFAALRREDGWLGAQASIRVSPSVAWAAKPLRTSTEFRGFVGLGDPNLTDGNVEQRTALLGSELFFPELPETANELTFMALSFGGNPSTDVFTRQNASEDQIWVLNNSNRLADISILALATHGLLSSETGVLKSPGLLLSLPTQLGTDGILTAQEIYHLRIGADLVVLSACNTGTPDAGAGLSDLASSFLYAGAGALILTHWEIDSGAGVEIMKRIAIDQRNRGNSNFSTSLQEAVRGMLADPAFKKFHHPRFWASHFILG